MQSDKDRFIAEIRESLVSDKLEIEDNISRNKAAIADAYKQASLLRASIDVNYSALSASQTVNSETYSKVDYYDSLIVDKENDNRDLRMKLDAIDRKISRIDAFMITPESDFGGTDSAGDTGCTSSETDVEDSNSEIGFYTDVITDGEILRKLEGIAKIIQSDPYKAKLDIEKVISDLRRFR